jgi:hypothetical protein
MTCQFFNFYLPHSERCVTVIKYGNLNNDERDGNGVLKMRGDLYQS